jgi:tape measure domain-containing protein
MTHLKSLRDAGQATRTTAQDEANRAAIMQRGREITEQTRSSQDRLNRSLAEARRLFRDGAISAATYSKHVSELKKNAASASGGMLGGFGGKALGTLGAITGGMSLAGVGKEAIKMSADVERAQAAMEAFTGSSAKAATMLDSIRKLSSVAGLGFRALNEGASAMMGYGVSTEETTKKLRQFAEISRGDTERFKSLALAFGQVNAAGRLMGQEVLQMVNAGFNPLQEIARTTGIEFSTLKKMMENGQVSVDMVSKAFDTATSAGGRFNGMLETIGKTSAGSLGRLSAEWEILLDKLGKSMPVQSVSNEITRTIHDSSTMFSQHEEQVKRRMEDARKNPDYLQFFDDGGQLADAARKTNALDEKIKQTQFYKENQALDKQRAEAKAAEEARKKRIQDGVDSLRSAQMDTRVQFHEKNDPLAFKQFTQIESMLEGPKKKQASEDFAKFGNINRILPLLDRELQIEFNKLGVLQKQNAERKSLLDAKTNNLDKHIGQKSERKSGPPTTAAGLTREQHEFTSYQSYGHAMQAESELRRAELDQQRMMQVERQRRMADMLPQLEMQVKAHSPVAAIAQGSQEAYKLMVANQTRRDVKNDPQINAIDKQIAATNRNGDKVVAAVNRLAEKLDFEMIG